MTIWGNHSATQYPDAFNARIRGMAADRWIADDAWINFDFIPRVAKRGAEVIAARGLPLSAFARAKIDASVAELQAEAVEVAALGLLP